MTWKGGVWGDAAYQGQREKIRACAPWAQDFTNRRCHQRGEHLTIGVLSGHEKQVSDFQLSSRNAHETAALVNFALYFCSFGGTDARCGAGDHGRHRPLIPCAVMCRAMDCTRDPGDIAFVRVVR